MDDLREQYKGIILKAARMAVRGGAMSEAFEEFLIDSIDEAVDGLSDPEFSQLLSRRKMPVRDIEEDSEYVAIFAKIRRAEGLLNSGALLEHEVEQVEAYCAVLRELIDEFKSQEWG